MYVIVLLFVREMVIFWFFCVWGVYNFGFGIEVFFGLLKILGMLFISIG